MDTFFIGLVQAGAPVLAFWLMLLSENFLDQGERVLAVLVTSYMVWAFIHFAANDPHIINTIC